MQYQNVAKKQSVNVRLRICQITDLTLTYLQIRCRPFGSYEFKARWIDDFYKINKSSPCQSYSIEIENNTLIIILSLRNENVLSFQFQLLVAALIYVFVMVFKIEVAISQRIFCFTEFRWQCSSEDPCKIIIFSRI